ncbi:hypothetical protein IEQ34_007905 [Dendrobium chrysotoxum]|uniref:H15 domain-containing protein n=1 Tax=Dendrobium chrysotoxum TaxID=161865 RepID=A0AAV7H729_DENCH|nr:hypothetical protein IEQ34_007905 [Dendrobium chrysotoxum]
MGEERAAHAQPVRHMRRYSRVIGNCVGDGGGGGAEDGVLPSPNRRTPDHPPYSEMVSVALQALAEENGSTESSISAYIKSTFNDLPWGHDRLLPYYLRKLVDDGELTSPFPDRYQLPFESPPSVSIPVRRRGRPRLYPANPNPSVFPRPSSLPRHRGRSSLQRRRGRPPKIHAEEMAPLQVKQGTSPPRRGRGRFRLQRGDSMGRTSTRRPGLRIPRSRGSKRRRDSLLDSDTEEMNCQSGNPALLDDFKNRGSECSVLVDPEHIELEHAQLEQGHPFVAPEQSEVGKGQFLGEESSLLILEPGTMTLLLGPEHYEHVEGQPLQGEEQPILAPEKTEVSQDQSLLGEKLSLLTPEQGKMPPFLAPELFEHAQGQSMQDEEAHPFAASEQTELGKDQLSLGERPPSFITEQAKVPPFLAPELFEHAQGQSMQEEEAHPFAASEQTELGKDQSSLGERPPSFIPEQAKVPPFLAPELFEHAQGQSMQEEEAHPFAASEQTELGKDQSSLGERPPSFIPEQAKVPPFSAPEFFEPDHGQPQQGEAQPFMPHEQTELVQKKSTEIPPLLSPEQPEHDHGLPLVAVEESEEGHEQMLPGISTADPKEGELVLMPGPDEEEVENAAVSNKKRKSHGKRRSLRLWFES